MKPKTFTNEMDENRLLLSVQKVTSSHNQYQNYIQDNSKKKKENKSQNKSNSEHNYFKFCDALYFNFIFKMDIF